jgi:hypothetical protein
MRTCQPRHRITVIVLSAMLTAMTFGCASGRATETYSSVPADHSANAESGAQAPQVSDAESGFAGVWQGTTLANCAASSTLPSRCNAEQLVTITLLQGPDSKFTGRYTCAYGTMDCYHANETGKVIDVSIAGARMNIRIIMPDATSCIFTGRSVNQTINGGYTCYQGGSLIEQGSWRARRSY